MGFIKCLEYYLGAILEIAGLICHIVDLSKSEGDENAKIVGFVFKLLAMSIHLIICGL